MPLRSQFYDQVIKNSGIGGTAFPLSGVQTTPKILNDDGTEGSTATAYADRTSVTTASSTTTDSSGKVSYYLDVGNYNIHFHDPSGRISDYVRQYSSVTNDGLEDIATIQLGISEVLPYQVIGQSVHNVADEVLVSSPNIYTDMPTPDVVDSVVINNVGDLILVWYTANWYQTGGPTEFIRSAIFLNNTQMSVPSSKGPQTQAATHIGLTGDVHYISSSKQGLISIGQPHQSYGGDVSTGQILGFTAVSTASETAQELGGSDAKSGQGQIQGGPCSLWASPGVYSVGVRYKTLGTSPHLHVSNRHLRVAAIPFVPYLS